MAFDRTARQAKIQNAFVAALVLIGCTITPAFAQSCTEKMAAAETMLDRVTAELAQQPSVCRQCQISLESFEVWFDFNNECPQADPTGEQRAELEISMEGLRECVRSFC
ncbi:hypothetical protein [Yoonia vestfoldensis]|uniref:hypothetical protein n=1 Tax=Yoonia vestfoldensis TaxID=245188 RepID=UPI0003646E97|nr:hypothetical protein [Yoonia vestfoldensis]